jgi:hypothetical protein
MRICHDGCGNDDTNMRGFPLGALLAHVLSKNTQVCHFWEIMQTESERGWGGFHKLAERRSREQGKPRELDTNIKTPFLASWSAVAVLSIVCLSLVRGSVFKPFVLHSSFPSLPEASLSSSSRTRVPPLMFTHHTPSSNGLITGQEHCHTLRHLLNAT